MGSGKCQDWNPLTQQKKKDFLKLITSIIVQVPHVQLPEASAGPVNLQSTQMISTQASSMAGGLVTSAAASIASIWRGWTGR